VIDAGDVHLADVGAEIRRHVVVVSSARFHRLTGRAIVAPITRTDPLDIDDPFFVEAGDETVHVASLRSTSLERLLDRTDRLAAPALRNVRRAVLEALR
jgi:mRNA-degrading endonuclease toxin of MazEF toxin-antitoxin module